MSPLAYPTTQKREIKTSACTRGDVQSRVVCAAGKQEAEQLQIQPVVVEESFS